MYLTANERRYWVEEIGSSTGTPVVFLHGFTGTRATWYDVIASFSATNRCIALDLPGHGKSTLTDPIRMEDFCEDLALLFEQLAIGQAHLVGYSMGGRAALSFAISYPKRVATLTLESASPGLESSHEQVARQTKDDSLAQKIEENGIIAFVEEWEDLPLFATQKNMSEEKKEKIHAERLAQSERGLAASLRGMGTGKQPSWWDQLATASSPVLLIAGSLDKKFVSIAEKMATNFRNATLHIVPNTGHAVHVEQTEKFGTIVKDFIYMEE
ncbi:putative 2-succinyl-6-hydroxy-2,4-cyclohexadiene-1-carboxylate synthase [Paraliobacillus quinghaiensis]|uniref:Putative 2-succinyl-6-hydroxy-2,4-cyclohexadiene-1-carboxylate synthase n=1 Tax=Paraliobacillus quinghaiensis TaxID=470815 RepID=A0A917WVR9_9BACI|nr:2-succinyl-6-hydroxy-2,4-cyclohexadiene-1-carboxylate synthase [Paraliobacillus quinghaiensis]GGM37012.1 putative 2-succinyl-6-hydroxy-2,4-cyclohexadiene-1-carboxylate synthase [Paraliobacillus quinghaiensis]